MYVRQTALASGKDRSNKRSGVKLTLTQQVRQQLQAEGIRDNFIPKKKDLAILSIIWQRGKFSFSV